MWGPHFQNVLPANTSQLRGLIGQLRAPGCMQKNLAIVFNLPPRLQAPNLFPIALLLSRTLQSWRLLGRKMMGRASSLLPSLLRPSPSLMAAASRFRSPPLALGLPTSSPSPLLLSSPLPPSLLCRPNLLFFPRPFSSAAPSNIALIKSSDALESLLDKARNDSLPTVFYYTASWCGPCKFISPFIEDLSKKYPNVNIYKIDVDEEDLGKLLSEIHISSVPTFHFFQGGKRASELTGADAAQLRSTMEKLYS